MSYKNQTLEITEEIKENVIQSETKHKNIII